MESVLTTVLRTANDKDGSRIYRLDPVRDDPERYRLMSSPKRVPKRGNDNYSKPGYMDWREDAKGTLNEILEKLT